MKDKFAFKDSGFQVLANDLEIFGSQGQTGQRQIRYRAKDKQVGGMICRNKQVNNKLVNHASKS